MASKPRVFTRRGAVRPPYNPSLAKYYHKRFALFSRYAEGISLDAEGWFSATPENVAKAVVGLTSSRQQQLVADAFCGCGGDAIQQALAGNRVVAVDIDADKIEMCRRNARIYGVADRIEFIVGDAVTLLPRLRADVCYLSPPWGGPDYGGKCDLATMRVGGERSVDGHRLAELAAACAPIVACYLPAGVDEPALAALAARTGRRCEGVRLSWGGGTRKPPRTRAVLALLRADTRAGDGEARVAVREQHVEV